MKAIKIILAIFIISVISSNKPIDKRASSAKEIIKPLKEYLELEAGTEVERESNKLHLIQDKIYKYSGSRKGKHW